MSKEVIVTRAQDPRDNLCDSCKFEIPECEPGEGLLEYGSGVGGDNVIACDKYERYIEEERNAEA